MSVGSRLDIGQIAKREHDEELLAKKVRIVGTELGISVSAEDGDSVESVSRVLEATLEAAEEFDIPLAKEIIVAASPGFTAEVTIDGTNWVAFSVTPNTITPVFAQKIRFDAAVYIRARS